LFGEVNEFPPLAGQPLAEARSRACPVVPKGLYGVERVKKRKREKEINQVEVA